MSSDPPAARAARRPTDHPGRFLIPREELPPGFAARVADPGGAAAPPRPAATVVLVREGRGGVEALLLRRPRRSSFAADAWVFPGGRVDPEDAALDLDAHGSGPPAEAWARRLGTADPAEARGYVVAALREAWEETGILLAEEVEEGDAGRLRAARDALLSGTLPLAALLARERLRLSTGDLIYLAHWITPEPEPRRFDTRFFLARVPPGAACELRGEELAEARWVRPADAVEAAYAGELRLLPPTLHTLRRLAEHPSLERLWAALRDAPVPTFLPRMRPHPEGVEIEIEDQSA